MKNLKNFAIGAAIGGAMALVASGVANARTVVNPGEPMVKVPGLERLGPSRISTVTFCAKQAGVDNWRALITDYEYQTMESCLQEQT